MLFRVFKYVKLGAHSRSDRSTGEMIPITSWKTYPKARPNKGPQQQGWWDIDTGGVDSDFSILVLAWRVTFTKYIQAVCLPSAELPNSSYREKRVWVSGWGYTFVGLDRYLKAEYGRMSDTPKKVVQVVKDESSCRAHYRINCEFCGRSTMLCAYGEHQYNSTVNTDSCQGDSGGKRIFILFSYCLICEYFCLGLSNIDNDYLFLCFINHNKGPLVQYVSGRAVLIGVVSFGYGCGKIRAPGIYAKVDNVLPWIEKMKRTYN